MPVALVGETESGISIIAHILDLCGVSLGGESHLTHANPMTEEGVGKAATSIPINDRIYEYLRVTYGTPFAPPVGWHNDAALEPIYQEASALIATLFGDNSNWVFTDPLTSFTIPFWQRVVPDLKFVVSMRNPIDVAASSKVWYLNDCNLSYAHWYVTYMTIFWEAGPKNCVMAFYEEILADYRSSLNQILDFLDFPRPIEGSDLDGQIYAFISSIPRYHYSSIEDVKLAPGIPNPVRRLYIDIATNGIGGGLDKQLTDREDFLSIFTPMMEMASVVNEFAQIEKKNKEYRGILNSRTHRLAASVCKVLIRFSEFRKSLRRPNVHPH